jgi:hypothetical protein
MANDSVFAVLSTIDCKGHIEKKNNLSYLSWAWAWQILKEKYPSATYTIYENKDGLNYHTDGHTCWVKTGVTVDGIEHIEYLPIMDFRNASIPVGKVTSFDVNKAIQRSLTKAVARHGLGLYIYAGEDIPDPYDDELRAMVNAAAPAPSLSAPKSNKEMMHQNHPKWQAMLDSILAGKITLEKVKERYCFPDADEIVAKEWLLTHQM